VTLCGNVGCDGSWHAALPKNLDIGTAVDVDVTSVDVDVTTLFAASVSIT